jgi:glycosyltransferase involved in cell wall biosynthesis
MSEDQKSKATAPVRELSVVLPAYNEEPNIERVVRQVVAYLEPTGIDYEILPVNDGSRTARRTSQPPAAQLPRVRPQHHPQNRGYGAALRTGFDAAVKRYVFYMDGDGQFDIKDLDRLLPLATEEAIVTGFRIERRDPLVRRLNAKLFGGWLVRILLEVRVKDLNCAFKLIPKKVLTTITLESTGALINAELYGRAIRAGFGIREVGGTTPREAGADRRHLSVILRAFYDLVPLAATDHQHAAEGRGAWRSEKA